MRARIDYYCRPQQLDGEDIYNVHTFIDLPFVPAVGTDLKVTPKGDYVLISCVQYDASPGGCGLIVTLEEPDEDGRLWPWESLKAEGWILDHPAMGATTAAHAAA